MLHRRMTTLPFLLLALYPFVIFDSDYVLLSYCCGYLPLFRLKYISCPLRNSNTLWNTLMVIGRNVEKDKTTCYIEE